MGKVVYFESGIIMEFEKEYSNRKHVRETVRLEQSWHKERFGARAACALCAPVETRRSESPLEMVTSPISFLVLLDVIHLIKRLYKSQNSCYNITIK